MTNILNLPVAKVSFVVGTNEDWIDSLAYFGAKKEPVDLRGIAFASMVRIRDDDPSARLVASTEPSWDGIPRLGALTTGGENNNVLAWTVPASTMRTVLPGTYVIDVLAAVLSRRVRILTGTVQVVRGITR